MLLVSNKPQKRRRKYNTKEHRAEETKRTEGIWGKNNDQQTF
jgi:hypothetical protein